MTQALHIQESRSTELPISSEQASRLEQMGRKLASSAQWWGSDIFGGEEDTSTDRTVIRCRQSSGNAWRVIVKDAVGLVSVGDLLIHVHPKIPAEHFIHLWTLSGRFPSIEDTPGETAVGNDLWALMVHWFLSACEVVLRRDLVRDYVEKSENLKVKRGKIRTLATARAYYAGRLEFDALFEEFGVDTPLNRILKEGLRLVLKAPHLEFIMRRRAAALLARLSDVGQFRASDLLAITDRRTRHYRDAIILGKHFIRSIGRHLGEGDASTWTFLVRSPEMIEDGIRQILRNHLGNVWGVEKRGRQISGTSMRLTPDLVFADGAAVGDVKYKLVGDDWSRPDLYQLTTYATAYSAYEGAIFAFNTGDKATLPKLEIGGKRLCCISWNATSGTQPKESEGKFVDAVNRWLESGVGMQGDAEA